MSAAYSEGGGCDTFSCSPRNGSSLLTESAVQCLKLIQVGAICRRVKLIQGGAICRHVKLLQGGAMYRHVKLLCIDFVKLNLKSNDNSGLRERADNNYSHFKFVLREKLTLKMETLGSSTPSLTTSIQAATSHDTPIFDNLLLETAYEEVHGRFVFGSR